MATGVPVSSHIITMALGILFAGLLGSKAQAANLMPEERTVCPTLGVCLDIIRRHDASEFDYEVLAREFRKFGFGGRKALFGLLDTDSGNSDIARMLSRSAPLSSNEISKLKKKWTLERAETYLPLLEEGQAFTRDFLLLTLGSDQADVREQARQALLKLPTPVKNQPIPQALADPLLEALSRDPVGIAAPYLGRLNSVGNIEGFAELLKSGNADIVSSAYLALHRNDPATAFGSLLSEMGQASLPGQARAIGDMLLRRHAQRSDGFYLNFARDISGDKTRPVSARASGLHAVLISGDSDFPELTPERTEAFAFLVKGQPFATQDIYMPYLKRAKAEEALSQVWKIAEREKWINRDQISTAFKGTDQYSKIVGDLLKSDDFRSFSYGLTEAGSIHEEILRTKMNHPVKSIRDFARRALNLPASSPSKRPCIISSFDANDRVNQMPFFEGGWVTTPEQVRVSFTRRNLKSAHATSTGWLAGYSLGSPEPVSKHRGGALLHYDNQTGEFKPIGRFSGPAAILPNRALKLGETTNRFWVIDRWGGESEVMSAFSVNLSGRFPQILHLGALPSLVRDFTVAPNGDLLMRFDDEDQMPIRMSPRGHISLACRPLRSANAATALN